MAMILKGAPVAKALDEKSMDLVAKLKEAGISPTLAIVRIGERADDLAYERAAVKRCAKVGVAVKQFCLPDNSTTKDVVDVISDINNDSDVHGCLVFLPLPKHIDEAAVKNSIAPLKDVDGASKDSLAGVFSGDKEAFLPCTARACAELLDHHGYDLTGKRAVVIGRSLVIGKPVAMELLRRNATLIICHTRTKDIGEEIKRADVVVVAAGKAGVVTEEHLAEGQWVLDVGINVNEDGGICGDVSADYESSKAAAITPVPGGIGNITTAVLARHTIEAAAIQNGINFVDF